MKRKSREILSLLLAAGLIAGSALPSVAQDTARTYAYRVDKTQITSMPGRDPQEARTRIRMNWTVKPIDSSACSISVSEAGLRRDPAGSSGSITTANNIRAIVRLDERGGILSAEGLSGNAWVREAGGTDYFISELNRLFLYRPEGELAPGAEWIRQREFPAARSSFDLTYTVVDTFHCIERLDREGVPALRIEVASSIIFEGEGPLSGYPATTRMAGLASTTILVEASTGFILSSEEHNEAFGGIDVEGMVIDLEGRSTTAVEIVK
jgi:hypothetical protein